MNKRAIFANIPAMSNYKTFVIGFPRIGSKRELKFAEEKYFAEPSSADELKEIAKTLRAYGWKKQRDAGIDLIPSNDFSYYDNMLDTAVMLGAVPERYKALGLNALDTYFAMAHGYQGTKGDVKALPMKKWFNTNYHYIVPELDGVSKIKLDAEKVLDEFAEAKNIGVQTVPAVIGPYTFLKFATYADEKKREDYKSAVAAAYKDLLAQVHASGAEWISIAEPALVFDTDSESAKFFEALYKEILAAKKVKVGDRVIIEAETRSVYFAVLLVYALPYLKILFPYDICVLIATTLIPSAFCSEHLMSGINTIGVGQIEAARALGLNFFQMIRRVIIPQALRSTVLPMTNLLVATMLTTSLASQVPMRPMELTGIVSYINTRSAGGVAAFAISAVLYIATALLIGFAGSLLDRKVRILR